LRLNSRLSLERWRCSLRISSIDCVILIFLFFVFEW
jgi:hypothetical protein